LYPVVVIWQGHYPDVARDTRDTLDSKRRETRYSLNEFVMPFRKPG
jgi:hypothetical protein